MKQGDVVLTPVPQADGVIKNRPAIFLREMPPYRDLLVCGVSTQLHQEVKGFDEVVQSFDPDFGSSGLRSTSLIRLGFLAVLPRSEVIGSIGSISSQRHKRLLKTLSDYLLQCCHEVVAQKAYWPPRVNARRRPKLLTQLLGLFLLSSLTLTKSTVPAKITSAGMFQLTVTLRADADHV